MTDTQQFTDAERALVEAVSRESLMRSTTTIARWLRLSGSEEEARAFDWVGETCRGYGMRVERHTADVLVSWPGKATLELLGPVGRSFPCITHAFAAPTPPGGITGELIEGSADASEQRGKIVISDGLANPNKAIAAQEAGVLAQINVNDEFVLTKSARHRADSSPEPCLTVSRHTAPQNMVIGHFCASRLRFRFREPSAMVLRSWQ